MTPACSGFPALRPRQTLEMHGRRRSSPTSEEAPEVGGAGDKPGAVGLDMMAPVLGSGSYDGWLRVY